VPDELDCVLQEVEEQVFTLTAGYTKSLVRDEFQVLAQDHREEILHVEVLFCEVVAGYETIIRHQSGSAERELLDKRDVGDNRILATSEVANICLVELLVKGLEGICRRSLLSLTKHRAKYKVDSCEMEREYFLARIELLLELCKVPEDCQQKALFWANFSSKVEIV
jgi:hypothetical protein